jgi:Arc/MetJ-type ribon-helix-helix transcriptional regulator
MTIHLPEDLERFVKAEVLRGHFDSEDDAITQAVLLLRQQSQKLATRQDTLSEDEWERRLLQSGLLTSIPPLPSGAGARREFQPITIEGEPLSETIIRERR